MRRDIQREVDMYIWAMTVYILSGVNVCEMCKLGNDEMDCVDDDDDLSIFMKYAREKIRDSSQKYRIGLLEDWPRNL